MTGLLADRVAQASTSYDAAKILPEGVFWIEGRADGRDVLVRWTPASGPQDLLPADLSVASCVHEYGGGAWAVTGDTVWFCNADDQRLYQITRSGAAPVDRSPERPGATRYADLCVHPGRRFLWCVRERHEQDRVLNDLVRIPARSEATPRTVASGWDFYAFPRPSPDGRWLAWTCWNAPLMPWDGTFLYVAEVKADGSLGEPVRVAGGSAESVFQPEWSPEGELHFVSDRNGWWNLYAWRNDEIVTVLERDVELGVAQWEFGYSTYAFLDSSRIAIIAQHGASQSLEIIEQDRSQRVDLPYTSIKPYLTAHGSEVALIASNAAETPAVMIVNANDRAIRKIAGSQPAAETTSLSKPEAFSFAARDGVQIRGLFFQPWASADLPPPLVVKAHPGPTANVQMRLDWHTQYLASHGFAVAEIDYRGSTGYGRAFRNSLRGVWGERDALDCAGCAEYLARQGRSDPLRTTIWGASAGGYTALRAAILTDVFAGCIARSPVIDPQTWRETAPKFQAHQVDSLIGHWPAAAPTYKARSVLRNAHAIRCPVLLLHGATDPVTPVSQSKTLAGVLGDQAQLVVFPDQGHSLGSTEVMKRTLELELDFLREAAHGRR